MREVRGGKSTLRGDARRLDTAKKPGTAEEVID